MIMMITSHLHNQPLFPASIIIKSQRLQAQDKNTYPNVSTTTLLFPVSFTNNLLSDTGLFLFFYFICQKISSIFVRFFLPMDARSCTYRSLTSLLLIVFLVLINVEKENGLADGSSDDDALLCGTDLSSFLPLPYSNLQHMVCKRLWNSFMLRVSSFNTYIYSFL